VRHALLRAVFLFAVSLPLAANSLAEEDSFMADAKAGVLFRSMYFRRDLPQDKVQESSAASGQLWGHTGYWRDFLQFGGAVYGDVSVYGPKDHDGGGLLKPGQEGFAVIAEAYTKLKFSDRVLTLGRQRIGENPPLEGVRTLGATDLNYLGARDFRMLPLTYEAAMLNGSIDASLRYQAGYVSKVKDINSDQFVSMSRLAGVGSEDEGMWTGGVQWSPRKDVWAQGFYYYVKDTLRIGYADLDWVTHVSSDSYYRVAVQYTDQRSDGANLLTGRAFHTWNTGAYGEFGWRRLKVYGALAATGEGEAIRTPYSNGPSYMTERVKTFNRAGEDAAMLGTTFDLASAGLHGFSIDVNIAEGRNAINAVTHAALPDMREFDSDFCYRFAKESPLSGMRLRARWATVTQDYGSRTDRTNDLRFDVNWGASFK
jgi:hypothetical protein